MADPYQSIADFYNGKGHTADAPTPAPTASPSGGDAYQSIADFYNKKSTSSQPEQQSEGQSWGAEALRQVGLTGRYLLEGAAGFADPVNMALGLPLASQTVGKYLTKAGLPEPETATERVVGDVSRSLVPIGGQIKAAGTLGEMASPMTREIAAALSQSPGLQAAATATGSGAGGIASESGADPTTQLAASLLGGVAPSLAFAPIAMRGVRPTVTQTLDDAIPAMKAARPSVDSMYDAVSNHPQADAPFPVQQFLPKAMDIADEFEGFLSPKVSRRLQEFQAGVLADQGEMPAASGAAPRDMTVNEAAKFYKTINSTMGNSNNPTSRAAGRALKNALNDSADSMPSTDPQVAALLQPQSTDGTAWDAFKAATANARAHINLDDMQEALDKGPGKLGALMDKVGPDQLAQIFTPQELSRLSVIRMADEASKGGGHKLMAMTLGGLAGHMAEGALEHILPVPGAGPLAGAVAGLGVDKLMERIAQQRGLGMLNPRIPNPQQTTQNLPAVLPWITSAGLMTGQGQ